MAKRARRNGRGREKRASGVAVAMRRRFATQQTSHGDKRERRRNRQSWRQDEQIADGD